MLKFRHVLAGAFLALCLPSSALASGALIKGTASPAVYYVDEGKRYVFPNEKIYFSWYGDFSSVRTVSSEELASYPIGGNVTYKPASRLVKLQSDPRVFLVAAGGRLRWLSSEYAARALYGDDWNKKVDDLSDAFFTTYKEGETVASAADYDKEKEAAVASIADDLAARNGTPISREFVAFKNGAWSDPGVWGGTRPGTGARVTIPANVKVFYDMNDAPSLKTLDVFGTLELTSVHSVRLAARQITVRGALVAGSSETPIPADKRVEIVLTGAAESAVNDDGLTIDGGTLALYGASIERAWSRLAFAARPGATKLTLEEPVSWPVGAEILVLGATRDEQEMRTIVSIDGPTVTLNRPLEKMHRVETGLRSEVALLDRNISIEGAGGGRGSYVRGMNRAQIVLRDVELDSLGRKGAIGQSPLILDGVTGPVFASSVIRDSGNRCVVLRQTSDAVISENVAYGVYGHCIATEDGAEQENSMTNNLIADVRGGALPSDAVPSGFLLKHPGNRLEGNVVVGSEGFGYWYLLADTATTNAGVTLHPREADLGSFVDNVARDNAKIGLYIDDGKGKGDYIPERKAVFSGLTATLNGERGFWIRGVNVEVTGARVYENPIGGTLAAFGAALKDSTFAGRLASSEKSDAPRTGFTFDGGPVTLQDVTFERFTGASAALGFEKNSQSLVDPRSGFRHLTFTEANVWHAPDPVTSSDRMAIVRDLDTGDAIGTDSPFLGPSCKAAAGNVRRCAGQYAQLSVALRGASGAKDVTFTELENDASVTLVPGSAFDGEYAYATVMEGGSYRATTADASSVQVSYDGLTQPLLVRLPAGAGASVRSGGVALEKKELETLIPGAWAYDGATSEAVLWLNPGDVFDLDR